MAETTLTTLATLAGRINAEHEKCEAAARSALRHAIAAGKLLSEAKQRVGHGEWSGWVKANFAGSDRTARLYMRLGEHEDQLIQNGNALPVSIRHAARLLTEPRADAWADGLDAEAMAFMRQKTGEIKEILKRPGVAEAIAALEKDPALWDVIEQEARELLAPRK